jgi:hypothetical protein
LNEARRLTDPRYSARPYAAVAAGSAIVLSIARVLTPSPSGVGTHEQLGIPACVFLKVTGWRCPSCGLTTSFAYAAHFSFAEAFFAQPFGFFLFLLVCMAIPSAMVLGWRRVPIENLLYGRYSNQVLYILLALYLGAWIYKLVT